MNNGPEVNSSRTYRIQPPEEGSPIFITITNATNVDGSIRPHDIFINSKNLDHYQWMTAITSLSSMVFKSGTPPEHVSATLQEVFNPAGGYFSQKSYVPSIVADIGRTIDRHIQETCLQDLAHLDLDKAINDAQAEHQSTPTQKVS